MSVKVTSNIRDVLSDLDALRKDAKPAVISALNKMADQVKTQAARSVRDAGYQLKIGTIKESIRIKRASGSNLTAAAIASGRPISLINYGAKQAATGVQVNVLKGRKVVSHAFIATAPNGQRQVFARVAGSKHKKNAKGVWTQLPIKKLYGPSIPAALVNVSVKDAIIAFIEDKFPKILQAQLNFYDKRRQ